MRKIWKFLGILISTAVLVLVLIFAYAGMKPAVPGNYETTVKTGGEIEANYLAHGNCEVKYTEQQVMENFKKYEIYYPDIIVDELQIQGIVKGSYHKH